MRDLVERAQARTGVDVAPSLGAMAAVLAEAARPGAAFARKAPAQAGPAPLEDSLAARVAALKREERRAPPAEAKTLGAALQEIERALAAGRREAAGKALDTLETGLASKKTATSLDAAKQPRPARATRLAERVEGGLAAAAREMGALRDDVADLGRLIEAREQGRDRDAARRVEDDEKRFEALLSRRFDGVDRGAASMAALEVAARRLLDEIEAKAPHSRGEIGTDAHNPTPSQSAAQARLEAALSAVQDSLADLSQRLARLEAVPAGDERTSVVSPMNESARFAAPVFDAGDAALADVLIEPGSGAPRRFARLDPPPAAPVERDRAVDPDSVAAGIRASRGASRGSPARGAAAWLAAAALLSLAALVFAAGVATQGGLALPTAADVQRYLGLDGPVWIEAAGRATEPARDVAPPAAEPPNPSPQKPAPPFKTTQEPFAALFEPPALTARDSALRALQAGPAGAHEQPTSAPR